MHLLEQLAAGFKRLVLPPPPHRGVLPLEEALPRLVPKVRPRFHYEALSLREGAAGPVFRPMAGSFALSLALDDPGWELDVSERELRAWGADFDALLQKARSNLLKRGGVEGFRALRPGFYRSLWQDGLDCSRVLLPGMLMGLPLQGDPVVVLAARDTLLVAGSEDPRALGWILEAALQFAGEDPRSTNGCPLRLRHFHWEPWEAGASHPAAHLLARVRRRRLMEEYSRQKTLLDRLHRQSGRTVAVAALQLERDPCGIMGSRTILPLGVEEGWLPEADLLGVQDPGKGTCHWLPWNVARQRLGDLLEPLGLFPERYRVKDGQGPEGLGALLG